MSPVGLLLSKCKFPEVQDRRCTEIGGVWMGCSKWHAKEVGVEGGEAEI